MSEVNLNTIETASMVDARGSACPGPLLEAKKGIGKVKVGAGSKPVEPVKIVSIRRRPVR
jgi:hypothetical protein